MIVPPFAQLAERLAALSPDDPEETRSEVAALAEAMLRPEWVGTLLHRDERKALFLACDLARDLALRINDPLLEISALRTKWRCGAATLVQRHRLAVLLATSPPAPTDASHRLLYGECIATAPYLAPNVHDVLRFAARSKDVTLFDLQQEARKGIGAFRAALNVVSQTSHEEQEGVVTKAQIDDLL